MTVSSAAPVAPIRYPPVTRWWLPGSVPGDSYVELARDGAAGNEGIALWAGRQVEPGIVQVMHVVALRGAGVVRGPELVRISPVLMCEVTEVLADLGVALVGQIHAHPPGCSTNLSRTDITYGIAVPYFLSVVAPDFALRPTARVEDWGVHCFLTGHGWQRLAPAEVRRAVVLVNGTAPVLEVGGGASGD